MYYLQFTNGRYLGFPFTTPKEAAQLFHSRQVSHAMSTPTLPGPATLVDPKGAFPSVSPVTPSLASSPGYHDQHHKPIIGRPANVTLLYCRSVISAIRCGSLPVDKLILDGNSPSTSAMLASVPTRILSTHYSISPTSAIAPF